MTPGKDAIMANLAVKNKMSALQLGLFMSTTSIGAQLILGTRKLVDAAGYMSWLSVLLGAVLFLGSALIMLKLGTYYPQKTIAEYLPLIWGKTLGHILTYLFNSLFFLQICTILFSVSKAIGFFMFDRTPINVIALGMLIVSVYCAKHELGTVLRVAQVVFLGMTIPFALIWLISLFNFQTENLMPFFAKHDLSKVLPAALETWNMYSGYEVILFLLPFTRPGKISITKSVSGAFGCMGVLFMLITVISIGVLTVDGVKGTIYPTMTVISSVDLPGTFVERLETDLALAWIPVVFDTLAIFLWISAQVLKELQGLHDHKPFVLLLTPLIYTLSMLLDSAKIYDDVSKAVTWLGLIFSFVIIPITLLLVFIKRRGVSHCKS